MMQPFDGGRFDKLFDDVFEPAVKAAGLEPYRVDRDPGVSVPISEIERGIKQSRVCFAEITNDNPNVWFELGYAISAGKLVCLVCSKERIKFPFDVQHRSIITYLSDAPRDFDKLRREITGKLQALIAKDESLEIIRLPETVSPRSGLSSHEIACIAILGSEASGLESSLSNYTLKQEMNAVGFNNLATHAAIRSLSRQGMLRVQTDTDFDGDPFEAYCLTEDGWDWITGNLQLLELHNQKSLKSEKAYRDELDDEIPF